jgi:glutamine cyclotransferase
MSNAPITQEMTIPEIVEQYPKTKEVFARYGLQVDGYKALTYENLFATSRVHQIDLEQILEELNQIAHK